MHNGSVNLSCWVISVQQRWGRWLPGSLFPQPKLPLLVWKHLSETIEYAGPVQLCWMEADLAYIWPKGGQSNVNTPVTQPPTYRCSYCNCPLSDGMSTTFGTIMICSACIGLEHRIVRCSNTVLQHFNKIILLSKFLSSLRSHMFWWGTWKCAPPPEDSPACEISEKPEACWSQRSSTSKVLLKGRIAVSLPQSVTAVPHEASKLGILDVSRKSKIAQCVYTAK